MGNVKEVSRGPRFVNWKKLLQCSLKIYLVVQKNITVGMKVIWSGQGMGWYCLASAQINTRARLCDQK